MPVSKTIPISLAMIATVVIFYVLAVGKSLLVPFAVAVMIWYIINALSRAYGRWLLRGRQDANWLTLFLALVTIIVGAGALVDMVQANMAQVADAVPGYKVNLERMLDKLMLWTGLKQLPSVGQLTDQIKFGPAISQLVSALTGVLGNTGLILIYVGFLLVEQKTFSRKLDYLISDPQNRASTEALLSHIQSDIQTYISIKTLMSLVTGLLSYGILILVGVDFAGFWAFTIFLLNYIPTIGSIIATVFPALLTLVQFDNAYPFLVVALGLTGVQFLIGNIVEPKLMGSSLNLSPLVVLLSLVLWGSVWGITGMFLSVPITVIMMIVLASFNGTRPIAILLSKDGRVKQLSE
jgi:predicted PurR-regulated permease PerM